jgi:cation diffusion facilitator family transporter
MNAMQEDGSRRAIVAAFLANLGIAIAKFVAFLITGAASMLAEAVHSLADTGNQGLLILGATRANRKATREHPFGFGRERYFWAFVAALVLFSLGSVFAIHEGVDKLRHPHELVSPAVAIGILVLAIALETWSFRTAIVAAQPLRGSKSWWSFIRRSKSPELPVVLLEDLGALLGLIIALIGVSLSATLDEPRFDAIGSIAIGALLGVIAIVLAIEMKSLLIGESAAKEIRDAIRTTIEGSPSVCKLIHMRTLHLGPDELLVAAKVEFDVGLDIPGLASAIDDLETAIRRQAPIARVIYVEPDIARSASS